MGGIPGRDHRGDGPRGSDRRDRHRGDPGNLRLDALRARGADVLVEDLRSTNGVFFDGRRIDMPVLLRGGSVVRIGDTTIELAEMRAGGRATLGPSDARATVMTGAAGAKAVRASGEGPA